MQQRLTPDKVGHGWADHDGFVGPLRPGNDPRREPAGRGPTGPDVGTRLPDIEAQDAQGQRIDVHTRRDGRPAVVVLFRSAVW